MVDLDENGAAMTKDTSVKNDGLDYDSTKAMLGQNRTNLKNTSSSRQASISRKNNAVAPYSLEDAFSNDEVDISKAPQMVED